LYEWQGLEAGALALIAAIFGAAYLQKQVRQAEEHREDELNRRRLAAIVALPLTLSKTSEMLQAIADEIANRFEKLRENPFADDSIIMIDPGITAFDPVEFPDENVRAFQDFVEALSDSHDIAHVAQLIASIQILLARLRSFDPAGVALEMALVSLMLDCAWAAHLNDSLYDHARSVGTKRFSTSDRNSAEDWAKVRTKSHSLLFSRLSPDPMMIVLNEAIDRYVANGSSPWITARQNV
jgi:hypothetical protein